MDFVIVVDKLPPVFKLNEKLNLKLSEKSRPCLGHLYMGENTERKKLHYLDKGTTECALAFKVSEILQPLHSE